MEADSLLLSRTNHSELEDFQVSKGLEKGSEANFPRLVQHLLKSLSLRQTLFGSTDPRFFDYCGRVLQEISSAVSFLEQKENYATALESAETVLQMMTEIEGSALVPERCELYNAFAGLYRKCRKQKEAEKCLGKALELIEEYDDPRADRVGTHLNMCALLSNRGNRQAALAHGRKAVELAQEEIVTLKLTHQSEKLGSKMMSLMMGYQNVAKGLEQLKEYGEAATWYSKALKLSKDSTDPVLNSFFPSLQSALKSSRRKLEAFSKSRPKSAIKLSSEGKESSFQSSSHSPAPGLSNTDLSRVSHTSKSNRTSDFGSIGSSSRMRDSKVSGKSELTDLSREAESFVFTGKVSSDNISRSQDSRNELDFDLITLGTMGLMDYAEDSKSKKVPSLRLLPEDLKPPILKSDLEIDPESKSEESKEAITTFLWRRDASESGRSDSIRNPGDSDKRKLPNLLDSGGRLSNDSMKPRHPAIHPRPSNSPFRLKRHNRISEVREKQTNVEELKKELISEGTEILNSRKESKKRNQITETEAALRIQAAFRGLKTRKMYKTLKLHMKNTEKTMVFRAGKRFSTGISALVTIYSTPNTFLFQVEFDRIYQLKTPKFTLNLQELIERLDFNGRNLVLVLEKPPSDMALAALKIQSAFRKTRAKKLVENMKNRTGKSSEKTLILRCGKKFETGYGLVHLYKLNTGKLLISVKINDTEHELSLSNTSETDPKQLLDKLFLKNGALALELAIPDVLESTESTELFQSQLTYGTEHYGVIIRKEKNGLISLECHSTSLQPTIITGSQYTYSEAKAILGQNLEEMAPKLILYMEIRENQLKLRGNSPNFSCEKTLGPDFPAIIQCFLYGNCVEMQIISSKTGITQIDLDSNQLLLSINKTSGLTSPDFQALANIISLDSAGFPLFRIETKPTESLFFRQTMVFIQKHIRRSLARSRFSLLQKKRVRNALEGVLVLRKSILLDSKYFMIHCFVCKKSIIKIKAVDMISKEELEMYVKKQVWRRFGLSVLEAVDTIVKKLRISKGKLTFLEEESQINKSERNMNAETAAILIQKSIRGVLARIHLPVSAKMELCRLVQISEDIHWIALYSTEQAIRIELFFTKRLNSSLQRSVSLWVSIQDLLKLYHRRPSFDTVLSHLLFENGVLYLQPPSAPAPPTDLSLLLTTRKRFLDYSLVINVYLLEQSHYSILEFRSESKPMLKIEASVSSLARVTHIPVDQLALLGLVSVHYLLELHDGKLQLTLNRQVTNIVLALRKVQAYTRGFLVRKKRIGTLRFNKFNLIACARRRLGDKSYALYAYFHDTHYKLEAVSKAPREMLKLFLDVGVFQSFGPRINKKKVFDELVFPRLEVQKKGENSILCINPIFTLTFEMKAGYIRSAATPSPKPSILKRTPRKSGLKKQYQDSGTQAEESGVDRPSEIVVKTTDVSIPSPRKGIEWQETEVLVGGQQAGLMTCDSPTEPVPMILLDDTHMTPSQMHESLHIDQVHNGVIQRLPTMTISPDKKASIPESNLSLREEGKNKGLSVTTLRISKEDLALSIERKDEHPPSEPKSPASRPMSPAPLQENLTGGIPSSAEKGNYSDSFRRDGVLQNRQSFPALRSVTTRSALRSDSFPPQSSSPLLRHGEKDLVARLGMDLSAGYFTVSIYSVPPKLLIEAISIATQEHVTLMLELKNQEVKGLDPACDEILASLDVVRTDRGQLRILTAGGASPRTVLYSASHVLSSRTYHMTVYSESQSLFIRAVDISRNQTLELGLGRRTRLAQEVTDTEIKQLIEKLKVQTVLGEDVLSFDVD